MTCGVFKLRNHRFDVIFIHLFFTAIHVSTIDHAKLVVIEVFQHTKMIF